MNARERPQRPASSPRLISNTRQSTEDNVSATTVQVGKVLAAHNLGLPIVVATCDGLRQKCPLVNNSERSSVLTYLSTKTVQLV